ncbi:MAG: cupin domain-containing protein, partial [Stellaceae bacterium]
MPNDARLGPRALSSAAREAMEEMNAEARGLNIWLRTEANAPAQRPWPRAELEPSERAQGRVGAGQTKSVPHLWRWRDISPYLDRIAALARTADVPPIAFADRQQFLLTNPGLGGRLQVTSAIRCAISIYNPGDVAPVHRHTPNASRTILSETGGYTTVEGERLPAMRGDLILTPGGTWHGHGNDGAKPVIWADVLDWPLLEFLDCIWLDEEFPGPLVGNTRAQAARRGAERSHRLYGAGGIVPAGAPHQDGTPLLHYSGAAIGSALDGIDDADCDPYEGARLRFVNPATGGPVFATLDYAAQRLKPGMATGWKRETASTLYCVMAGSGTTEVGAERLDWEVNDFFVVPNFLWRRHLSRGPGDAVLYSVSEAPV